MKSEPKVYSISDLKHNKKTCWEGVRNYQARNLMGTMKKGDLVLFYHSNASPPGVAGLAEVVEEAYPDHYSWDKTSMYYDEKSSSEKPRWFMVDIAYRETFARFVPLPKLKKNSRLEGLPLLKPGNRLSVQPISKEHFEEIVRMGKA